jgi:hypothetical protein
VGGGSDKYLEKKYCSFPLNAKYAAAGFENGRCSTVFKSSSVVDPKPELIGQAGSRISVPGPDPDPDPDLTFWTRNSV